MPTDEPAERPEDDLPAGSAGRGKKETLGILAGGLVRMVRGWLEPWVMLWRYWRAFSDLPPPPELRVLLERVFSGRGLYLYVR